jgi:hypothetical protein
MQARRLPAVRGWNWIVEGFRLFRTNPALLTFVVFGYWLSLIFLNLLPFIGFVVAPLCVPALSVSVMNGCRALARGEQAEPGVLFSGFRRNLKTLVTLGGLYLAGSAAALAVSALVDGGLLLEIMLAGRRPDPEALESSHLMAALQVALALMVPLLMAFWFAPLLAAWHGQSAAKALFFSFVACWRNWRAFLVYGAGVAFISAVLPGIILGVVAFVSTWLLQVMAVAVTMPILFVFVPTLFASFFVSYRDVFVSSGDVAAA